MATLKFDAAEFLGDETDQMDLLAEAFESADANFIKVALGTVARARGMTRVAKDAGVTREALYKALTETGDPKLSTLMAVTRALGLSLTLRRHEPVNA